jgi:hypothetical protein
MQHIHERLAINPALNIGSIYYPSVKERPNWFLAEKKSTAWD